MRAEKQRREIHCPLHGDVSDRVSVSIELMVLVKN